MKSLRHKRLVTHCVDCKLDRRVDEDGRCKSCTAAMGLKRCRSCRALLSAVLSFSGRWAVCQECRGVGKKPLGRPSVFADPDLRSYAWVLHHVEGYTWAKVARVFRCSIRTVARLFRDLDKGKRI